MSTDQTADPNDQSAAAPAAEDAGGPADPGRRRLMVAACVGAGGLITVAVGVPAAIMFIGPMLNQDPAPWRSVGQLDSFRIGETVQATFANASPVPWSGVTALTAVWLRRESEQEVTAFAVNCTHLGCPVRWEADARLFLCPCHGGAYYADGGVAAGPPPHGLNRYPVRIQDGDVQIQATSLPLK